MVGGYIGPVKAETVAVFATYLHNLPLQHAFTI